MITIIIYKYNIYNYFEFVWNHFVGAVKIDKAESAVVSLQCTAVFHSRKIFEQISLNDSVTHS